MLLRLFKLPIPEYRFALGAVLQFLHEHSPALDAGFLRAHAHGSGAYAEWRLGIARGQCR